jgi:hypothetical protein
MAENARVAAPEVEAPCTFSPEVLLRVADLIGLDSKSEPEKLASATEFISELDQTKTSDDYFSNLLGTLPRISLKPSTHASPATYSNLVKPNNGDSFVNTIKTTAIGRGTFGAVYESIPIGASPHGGYAYKFVTINATNPDEFERTARGIFLEAFIQLVLSMDPEKGSFVCGIEKMFCSDADTLVIKMEFITDSFLGRLGPLTPWSQVSSMLISIHELLTHFRSKYGFHHRDFHTGNLMMNGLALKLIDFGEACITCDGKTFSLRRKGAVQVCESADLLIFIASLYEFSPLQKSIKDKLFLLLGEAAYEFREAERLNDWYSALTTKDQRFQRTFYEDRKQDIPDETVFHRFYHYILNDPRQWKDDLDASIDRSAIARDLLDNYDRTFLDRLRAIPAAGGGRTRRGKGARRRATRRRRYRRVSM